MHFLSGFMAAPAWQAKSAENWAELASDPRILNLCGECWLARIWNILSFLECLRQAELARLIQNSWRGV